MSVERIGALHFIDSRLYGAQQKADGSPCPTERRAAARVPQKGGRQPVSHRQAGGSPRPADRRAAAHVPQKGRQQPVSHRKADSSPCPTERRAAAHIPQKGGRQPVLPSPFGGSECPGNSPVDCSQRKAGDSSRSIERRVAAHVPQKGGRQPVLPSPQGKVAAKPPDEVPRSVSYRVHGGYDKPSRLNRLRTGTTGEPHPSAHYVRIHLPQSGKAYEVFRVDGANRSIAYHRHAAV